VRTRENSSNFQRGHHQQPSFGCAGCIGWESQLGETCSIRHRPTCLKKSHVFSLNARAFILSRTIFLPRSIPLSLSLFYPFPPLFSFHLQPVPLRPFSTPLTTAAFLDLFRLYGSFKAEIPPDCQSFIGATEYPTQSYSDRIFPLSIV